MTKGAAKYRNSTNSESPRQSIDVAVQRQSLAILIFVESRTLAINMIQKAYRAQKGYFPHLKYLQR